VGFRSCSITCSRRSFGSRRSQIAGETFRPFDLAPVAHRELSVDEEGNSLVHVRLYDFDADLSTLKLVEHLSGREFDFPTYGAIESAYVRDSVS
jgi:hypothetical protein